MKTAALLAFATMAAGLACDKKESADAKPVGSSAGSAGKTAVVDRALGASTGEMVQAGKGAIVSQECAIACQAKPGIDSGACTARCMKSCLGENDTAAIDACANRVANESPPL